MLKYDYLVSVVTNDRKCDTEIQRYVGIMKDVFQRLSKVLRDVFRNKENVLYCYIISNILYGSEILNNFLINEKKVMAIWFK